MTDYRRLLDPEVAAFVAKSEAHYPPDSAARSIEGQRAVYDALCASFRVGHPAGVTAADGTLPGPAGPVPVRRYRREDPADAAEIVYFHGGGFVVGGLDSHDEICAELCALTGFPVTAVDYRLSPEHLHPAAFEDSLAAFRAVAAGGRRVLLAGDSAGGNLAAAVCHAVRGQTAVPAGQVLVYPGLGGEAEGGSLLRHAAAPMLTRDDIAFYRGIRTGGRAPGPDPTLAPLLDRSFADLPPTVAIAAECDPLADGCAAYAARIRAAGGRAEAWTEPGLVHGFLRARHMSGRARGAFWRIAAALSALGEGEWPFD